MWTNYWKTRQTFVLETPGHKLNIKGSSIGGKHTSYKITNWWNILLDSGIPSNFTPDYIFITHTHLDHIQGLTNNLLNCAEQKKTPIVCAPKGVCDHLYNYIDATFRCTKNIPLSQSYTPPMNLLPVSIESGENIHCFDMYNNGKKYCKIEYIKCFHSTPTTGYGFTELRHGLKKEFLNKENKCKFPAREMDMFKKNGEIESMMEWREIPLFCFLGDTNHKVLTETLVKYPVIIIECTFFKEEDVRKARNDKHMHWNNLKEFIKQNPKNYFKLIHFSQKYNYNDYIQFQEEIDTLSPTPVGDTPHVVFMGDIPKPPIPTPSVNNYPNVVSTSTACAVSCQTQNYNEKENILVNYSNLFSDYKNFVVFGIVILVSVFFY